MATKRKRTWKGVMLMNIDGTPSKTLSGRYLIAPDLRIAKRGICGTEIPLRVTITEMLKETKP